VHLRENDFRLARKTQVGPCNPVGTQLERVEVGQLLGQLDVFLTLLWRLASEAAADGGWAGFVLYTTTPASHGTASEAWGCLGNLHWQMVFGKWLEFG
jgi:hypothetical protein